MQFLKTLFWVVLAVIAVLFAKANWLNIELRLWGGLVADVKLPVLLLGFFLLGFLPTLLVQRARIWAMRRRLEAMERNASAVPAAPVPAPSAPPAAIEDEQRVATDSKVWPTP
jgi:putative membrane protein